MSKGTQQEAKRFWPISTLGEQSEAPAWFKEALARMLAVLDKTLANWTQDEIRDTNATDYQGSSQKSCTKTTGNQTENVGEQSEIIDIEAPLYEERSFKGGVLDLDDEAGEKSFGDGVLNLDEHQEPSGAAEQGSGDKSCSICCVDYEEMIELRILPCTHTFHKKCIDPWILQQNNTCPLCRAKANLWASAIINAE